MSRKRYLKSRDHVDRRGVWGVQKITSLSSLSLPVIDAILTDRFMAYAIVDRNFVLQSIGGDEKLIRSHTGKNGKLSLWEISPELIGSEPELQGIIDGRLPKHQLTFVNRDIESDHVTYLTLHSLPYRDDSENIIGILHTIEDVTELGDLRQKLTQQRNELMLFRDKMSAKNLELLAVNSELKQMDEIKSRFVSVAAHEFRTPLAAILGYVEILLEPGYDSITEDQSQFLQVVQRNARHLQTIVDDLLDVTRLETGNLDLIMRPVNALELVENVGEVLQPLISAKNQQLILDIEPGVTNILCDETRATQIITNLVANANQYTHEKGTITVKIEPSQDIGFIQFSVADDGIGIPQEEHSKLFDRFYRATNANDARPSGTGLGLYIVHSLVELHGGKIWVESTVGDGTTFYVTFPVDDGLIIQ